jgi:hypothetical protein
MFSNVPQHAMWGVWVGVIASFPPVRECKRDEVVLTKDEVVLTKGDERSGGSCC